MIFTSCCKVVLKNNYTKCKIIKNKILYIKEYF